MLTVAIKQKQMISVQFNKECL